MSANEEREYISWCHSMFSTLADGGAWGVPRSGLIFMRRGETLALTARMPWDEEMPLSAWELRDYQQGDFSLIARYMGLAGVTVTDETGGGKE